MIWNKHIGQLSSSNHYFSSPIRIAAKLICWWAAVRRSPPAYVLILMGRTAAPHVWLRVLISRTTTPNIWPRILVWRIVIPIIRVGILTASPTGHILGLTTLKGVLVEYIKRIDIIAAVLVFPRRDVWFRKIIVAVTAIVGRIQTPPLVVLISSLIECMLALLSRL